ncbi:MAG: hypothetical protein P1P65_06240 [Treponema sp.]
MTYTETIVSLIILFFFLSVLGQTGLPLLKLHTVLKNNEYADKNLTFVEQSFRKACTAKNPDFTQWRYAVKAVSGLEKATARRIYAKDGAAVYEAVITFNGKTITILTEYTE